MNRAQRIAAQLGVSQGAANHQLRKSLLYKYVRLANQHFCYKCGVEIEHVNDFSVEHKEPWEGRSTDLFWDLDNIAFSHTQCNRPHVVGAVKLRKVGPEGTAWCKRCDDFRPLEEFYRYKHSWHGAYSLCKMHAREDKKLSRERTGRH